MSHRKNDVGSASHPNFYSIAVAPQVEPSHGFNVAASSPQFTCSDHVKVVIEAFQRHPKVKIPSAANNAWILHGVGSPSNNCAGFSLWKNLTQNKFQVKVGDQDFTVNSSVGEILDSEFPSTVTFLLDGKKKQVQVKAKPAGRFPTKTATWTQSMSAHTFFNPVNTNECLYIGGSLHIVNHVPSNINYPMKLKRIQLSFVPRGNNAASKRSAVFKFQHAQTRKSIPASHSHWKRWIYTRFRYNGFGLTVLQPEALMSGVASTAPKSDSRQNKDAPSPSEGHHTKKSDTGKNKKKHKKGSKNKTLSIVIYISLVVLVVASLWVWFRYGRSQEEGTVMKRTLPRSQERFLRHA